MDIAKNKLPEQPKIDTEKGNHNSDYTFSISNLTFRKVLKTLLEFQALKNRIFRIFDGSAIPRYSKPIKDDQIQENQGDDINQSGQFGIGINKGNTSTHSIAGTVNENGNNYINAERVNIYEQSKSKEKIDRLVITLNGVDFNKFTQDKEIQEAVSLLLQKASGDTSVNFDKIEEGSIKITLNGSPEALKRLAALIDSGELGELKQDLEKLGLSIEDAKLISKEAKEEIQENTSSKTIAPPIKDERLANADEENDKGNTKTQYYKQPRRLPENSATVAKTIKPGQVGRVKFRGSYWPAKLYQSDKTIDPGTHVKIVDREGITLIVALLSEANIESTLQDIPDFKKAPHR